MLVQIGGRAGWKSFRSNTASNMTEVNEVNDEISGRFPITIGGEKNSFSFHLRMLL